MAKNRNNSRGKTPISLNKEKPTKKPIRPAPPISGIDASTFKKVAERLTGGFEHDDMSQCLSVMVGVNERSGIHAISQRELNTLCTKILDIGQQQHSLIYGGISKSDKKV